MRLQRHGCVVDSRGDEDDAAAGAERVHVQALRRVGVALGGGEEGWESGFQGVVGAEHIDVDNGFEGVGGEGSDWGEEVACCSRT